MAWFKPLHSKIIIILLSQQLSGISHACQQFQVNGANNWFPYFYRGDLSSGTMVNNGIIGDIVFQASNRIGIKAKLNQQAPWKRILYDLRNGKLDIVAGALKTKEREKIFYFSSPVFHSEFRIFVHTENQFQFKELEDLIGKNGIKIRSMSLGQGIDDYAFENLVVHEATNTNSLFKMVAAKRVEYGIFYLHSGLSELKKLKLDQTLVALPKPLTTEALYVAFSKNQNVSLKFNNCLKKLTK